MNTFLNDLAQYDNLPLLHLNIRGLRLNLDDFRIQLEESKHPFNVIYLTETWLKDHEFQTNPNYLLLRIHYEIKLTKDPAGIYLFKVNNRNTRTRCEICSKLTINTHLVLVFLLLTLSR